MNLVIITNNYPLGGRTEEAFLKQEILVLASSFQKVVVLPLWKDAELFDISFWPNNVVFDEGLASQYRERGKRRYMNFFNPVFLWACLREIGRIRNRVQVEYLIRTFVEGKTLSDYLSKQIQRGRLNIENTVIYSFWFADDAVGLGLMPKRIMPRWISRAHHYDLYDERVPIRSRVLRNRSFANVEKVLCCSEHGAQYLTERYPKWKEKIDTVYLGVPKPLAVPRYEIHPNRVSFLTVARIEPVKRPLLTFNALCDLAEQYSDYSISWTVVGDGSLMNQLKDSVHSKIIPNLHVSLLGEQPNAYVHSLLENQQFDWMIMLSESEGLPISIAEAMSYGIPSIATDVGGVKEEVVPEISGILLPENPTKQDLLMAIYPYMGNCKKYVSLRESTIDFWKKGFDSGELKKRLVRMISDVAPFTL